MSNKDYRDELLIYGVKPPERVQYTPEYIKYDKLLTPPECHSIIEYARQYGRFEFAGVGNSEPNQYRIDPLYRMVKSFNIRPEDNFEWLYHKVMRHIVWTNNERFHFDISGVNEYFQLLWYQKEEDLTDVDTELLSDKIRTSGHYRMHQDVGGGYSSLRKLSVVIQLSDETAYDGCRLTLITHRHLEIDERKQGDMIIFPSYLPHLVTPIERGERFCLVLWVSGPPFK